MQVKRTGDTPFRADLTSHVGLYEVKEDHFPRANADVLYQHRYGKCVLQRNDPLAITFAVRAMEVERSSAAIDAALASIARFNRHLYRQNFSAEIRKELQVDVELYPLIRLGIKSGLLPILGPASGARDVFRDATDQLRRLPRRTTFWMMINKYEKSSSKIRTLRTA